MAIPCPTCGFLTVDEDHYGTYNICGICAWEDDGVQLANPACGGGANSDSLIAAQNKALIVHPLTETSCNGIARDITWRPLDNSECKVAESEKLTKYWMNKAIYDPSEAYWNRAHMGPIYA